MVDGVGGDGEISLLDMLEELEHNDDYPTLKRGSHLSKKDISGPTAASGPTFVEGSGTNEDPVNDTVKSPEKITPEQIRKRVSGQMLSLDFRPHL